MGPGGRGDTEQLACSPDEECQKQGVEFVPTCLLHKQRRADQVDGDGPPHPRAAFWEPESSDGDAAVLSDSDSMTDLYPAELTARTDLGGAEHRDSTNDPLTEEDGKPRRDREQGSGDKESEGEREPALKRGKVSGAAEAACLEAASFVSVFRRQKELFPQIGPGPGLLRGGGGCFPVRRELGPTDQVQDPRPRG
ncbi:Surfeit locus protein 2 [Pteropus alecto]|uniref:Surfeit locus protein 2 n=1 Tax=Pteropus alecto TaxID=9402 RepID=L5K7L3_PTEAL|nr:Surfeit locus protein 2 [Pteropus alecto]